MRREFNKQTRKLAWDRALGRCESCTAKLFPGHYQFDHIVPDGLGGEPTLENCKVLCSVCHSDKTHTEDRPIMQKADNIRAKYLGLKPKRPWSQFRKKMSGEVVRR